VRGASIDWLDFYRGYQHQKVVLPTYPWDRKRYWVRRDAASHYETTKVVTTGPTTDKTKSGWLLSLLTATPPNERQALLLETILHELATVLELDKELDEELDEARTIKEHQSLSDLGIDSLMALEFTERIEFCLECSLDETLLFDYPTPKALVDYLLSASMPGHTEND
jgi:acyl transferase domain-containing protein